MEKIIFKMDKREMLSRAKNSIFSMGVSDAATELCIQNMKYGIAKIHMLQETLGFIPDAHFIGTPDMTITRNNTRWAQGFGYGGKLKFGSKDSPYLPLDIKPNACGMLVGGIDRIPSYNELSEKLSSLPEKRLSIDNIPLKWDFYESNHFVDVFEVEPLSDLNLPPYAFILHTSSSELKGENPAGKGLYFDHSPSLRKVMKTLETPFGPIYYLLGEDADEYFSFYLYAEEFSKRKREIAAEFLFNTFDLISNETHQGLLNKGEILLGAHHFKDTSKIYPFVLRSDLPAYLVRGVPNIKDEIIESLGFKKRAKNMKILKFLKKANLIPHGAGYTFPHLLSVENVIEINNKTRLFEVVLTWNIKSKEVIRTPRELPFEYRGQKVFLRTIELGLCEIVAKLHPVYVLKF